MVSEIVDELYLLSTEVVISAAMHRSVELRHVKQSRFTQGTLFVHYKPGWRFNLRQTRPQNAQDGSVVYFCLLLFQPIGR